MASSSNPSIVSDNINPTPGANNGVKLETAETTVEVFDDDYVNDAYARRSAIIDKKFLSGLSVEDQMELARIDAFLDAYEAPFYEPAKRMLQAVHDRLAAQQQHPAGQAVSKGK